MIAFLVDLGWKSSAICVVALLASWLLRSRAASERVVLLRAALAGLLLLPLAAWLLPSLDLALLPAEAPVADAGIAYSGDVDVVAPVAASFDPMTLIYAAGVAAILLRLAAGLFTLWRWTRGAARALDARWAEAFAQATASLRRPVRLRVSPRVKAPMSWGVAPAWVLITPGLEARAEQAEAVIAHELAHVRRHDWPVLLASQLATALFWFNPLVWLVDRELTRQTELAADDEAVRCVAQADYAQALLSVAGGSERRMACSMAVAHRDLARRITRVLESNARRPASRVVTGLLLVAAPAAAMPLAAVRVVPVEIPLPPAAPQPLTSPQVQEAAPAPVAARIPAPRRVQASARTASRSRTSSAAPALTVIETRVGHAGHPAPERVRQTEIAMVRARERVAATIRPPRPPAPRPNIRRPMSELDAVADRAVLNGLVTGLRQAAQSLEAQGSDASLPRELRAAHMRAASSYRREAQRIQTRISIERTSERVREVSAH